MKIFGLSPIWLLYAVIVGLLIGIVMIYSNTSTGVVVAQQILTPVPTPPPVIVDQPVGFQQSISVNYTNPNGDLMEIFVFVIILVLAFPILVIGYEVGSEIRRQKKEDVWR